MSTNWIYEAIARDYIPEWLIRHGIRGMLAQKIKEQTRPTPEAQRDALIAFVNELKALPIALHTDSANRQHYEVPAELFKYALGPRLKYSCALWSDTTKTLGEAEENMLDLYCQRADLHDGQDVLELGCGWGSLSLYLAVRYPNSNIVTLSNSATQKKYIDEQIAEKGIKNLHVLTANIVQFDTEMEFDRVISIEMFEHLKNYEIMLANVSRWLRAEGKLFIHIFTHKRFAYHYEDKDGTDWMTSTFFEGGTMPSEDLLLYFQKNVRIVDQWTVSGTHYQKTSEAWLANLKANKDAVMKIMAQTYGSANAVKWWAFWKLFFLACAELWGYKNGSEWTVSHYLFEPQAKHVEKNVERIRGSIVQRNNG